MNFTQNYKNLVKLQIKPVFNCFVINLQFS
jgi:hypothetical protein